MPPHMNDQCLPQILWQDYEKIRGGIWRVNFMVGYYKSFSRAAIDVDSAVSATYLASYSNDSCDNLNGTSLVPSVFWPTGGPSESSLASASCLEDWSLGFFFLLAGHSVTFSVFRRMARSTSYDSHGCIEI